MSGINQSNDVTNSVGYPIFDDQKLGNFLRQSRNSTVLSPATADIIHFYQQIFIAVNKSGCACAANDDKNRLSQIGIHFK